MEAFQVFSFLLWEVHILWQSYRLGGRTSCFFSCASPIGLVNYFFLDRTACGYSRKKPCRLFWTFIHKMGACFGQAFQALFLCVSLTGFFRGGKSYRINSSPKGLNDICLAWNARCIMKKPCKPEGFECNPSPFLFKVSFIVLTKAWVRGHKKSARSERGNLLANYLSPTGT